MAHSAMHFGVGLAIGAAAGLPMLRRALKDKTSLESAKWLATTYAIGGLAVLPSLLGLLGVPEAITSAWFMNIFLLHPVIDHLKSGGKLIGETLIVSCFFSQYAIMLFLLFRIKKRKASISV
jgi:hypothetical protein